MIESAIRQKNDPSVLLDAHSPQAEFLETVSRYGFEILPSRNDIVVWIVIPQPVEAIFQIVDELALIAPNAFSRIFIDIAGVVGSTLRSTRACMAHVRR